VEIQAHGSLIRVQVRAPEAPGVGVLLLGPAGIGKSECILELIRRGHRLVADDVVRIRRLPCPADAPDASDGSDGADASEARRQRVAPGPRLVGAAPEVVRHYMEIRGIGLLYVPDLFGPEAVLDESAIDLLCHLEAWQADAEFERVGWERPEEELAGARLPSLRLPARPAGSMATLVEVAAGDHLQRARGESAARRLDAALELRRARADGRPR